VNGVVFEVGLGSNRKKLREREKTSELKKCRLNGRAGPSGETKRRGL